MYLITEARFESQPKCLPAGLSSMVAGVIFCKA